MERLQELYKEVHDCHRNFEGKLSYSNLAIAMLTAAQYIEDDNFGDGGTYINPQMNAFWEEMEGNWASLCGNDRELIVKALRWGARAFNGTEAWLDAVRELDDMDLEFNEERQDCMESINR